MEREKEANRKADKLKEDAKAEGDQFAAEASKRVDQDIEQLKNLAQKKKEDVAKMIVTQLI